MKDQYGNELAALAQLAVLLTELGGESEVS